TGGQMASRTARKRRTRRAAGRRDDREICPDQPACIEFDIECNQKSIKVVDIEILNEAPDGNTWTKVDPTLIDAQGRAAALAALKKTATDGQYLHDCED